MRLHILSDLHLGFGRPAIPRTDADVVVLAGDIGLPREAVRFAYEFGKPLVYVPGNHEYYGGVPEKIVAELRSLARGTEVRILDEDEEFVRGVRFLGCTLWTDLSLFGDGQPRDMAVRAAWQGMRDFARIRSASGRPFTPEDMAERHRRNRNWLEHRLARPASGPTVVVTHHAPSPRSIHPRFDGALINAAYVTDLEHLLGTDRAALWIHGHTHDSFDYVVRGTRVVCNPRGYALEGVDQNRAFDPGLVIEL